MSNICQWSGCQNVKNLEEFNINPVQNIRKKYLFQFETWLRKIIVKLSFCVVNIKWKLRNFYVWSSEIHCHDLMLYVFKKQKFLFEDELSASWLFACWWFETGESPMFTIVWVIEMVSTRIQFIQKKLWKIWGYLFEHAGKARFFLTIIQKYCFIRSEALSWEKLYK